MKIDPNSPAFPAEGGNDSGLHANPGLTTRAHFAAMAMQGVLADPNVRFRGDEDYEENASVCVKMADALIAELNKEA